MSKFLFIRAYLVIKKFINVSGNRWEIFAAMPCLLCGFFSIFYSHSTGYVFWHA